MLLYEFSIRTQTTGVAKGGGGGGGGEKSGERENPTLQMAGGESLRDSLT